MELNVFGVGGYRHTLSGFYAHTFESGKYVRGLGHHQIMASIPKM